MRRATLLISLAFLVMTAFGQTISSSLVGTDLDQTGDVGLLPGSQWAEADTSISRA
jgi:hypothetical protein